MDQENHTPQGNTLLFPIIGGIILIIVLAVLGWSVLKEPEGVNVPSTQTEGVPQAAGEASDEPDAATAALSAQGTSDEIAAIDADLEATDLESLNDIDSI